MPCSSQTTGLRLAALDNSVGFVSSTDASVTDRGRFCGTNAVDLEHEKTKEILTAHRSKFETPQGGITFSLTAK